ncbi:MAG: hypothetical protein JWQ43_4086 [Glaciihabitans sp.]|nr:hypothetical protein [Glaciihabitans sp.]
MSVAVATGGGRGAVSTPAASERPRPGTVDPEAHYGRTRVTARALSSVVSAVAGESLGVGHNSVRVDLTDDAGSLVVHVSSPLRLPSLTRIPSDAGLVARTGGTVLDRAANAQSKIRARVTELTGSTVSRVAVSITGVEIRQEGRVR